MSKKHQFHKKKADIQNTLNKKVTIEDLKGIITAIKSFRDSLFQIELQIGSLEYHILRKGSELPGFSDLSESRDRYLKYATTLKRLSEAPLTESRTILENYPLKDDPFLKLHHKDWGLLDKLIATGMDTEHKIKYLETIEEFDEGIKNLKADLINVNEAVDQAKKISNALLVDHYGNQNLITFVISPCNQRCLEQKIIDFKINTQGLDFDTFCSNLSTGEVKVSWSVGDESNVWTFNKLAPLPVTRLDDSIRVVASYDNIISQSCVKDKV